MRDKRTLLIGDNPFQAVSHLSDERVRSRGKALNDPNNAAGLVMTSVQYGADGFMFTVNETTLSILRVIGKKRGFNGLRLYALIPDAREFVRLAITAGGILGIAKNLAEKVPSLLNLRAVTNGFRGILRADPSSLLRSYLSYEVFRVRSGAGRTTTLVSLLLHEVLTDMALALNMDWLFRTHVDFMEELGVKPGVQTRNFSHLVRKFEEWGIALCKVVIAAPFNSLGFQMSPSREEWEQTLARIPEAEVIAISILAGGYLELPSAMEYVTSLPNLRGVAVGVSNEEQARETFALLRRGFETEV